MNTARDTATCQRLDRWLSAYVDGELDVVHCLEVEDHIGECAECTERVAMLHATKVSVRSAVVERAPQALRERVCRTLLDEKGLDEAPAKTASAPSEPPITKLRYVVPLAAAATIALVVGALQLQRDALPGASVGPLSAASAATASIDTLVDELVNQHAHPPQLDVTDPGDLRALESDLRVRVRPPSFDDDIGAKYLGARQNPRSLMLRYATRNKNSITMYVFNTESVAVRSQRLEPRRIGARKVFVGRIRGYPVAATEHEGRGVLLTADELDDEKTTELVLTASR